MKPILTQLRDLEYQVEPSVIARKTYAKVDRIATGYYQGSLLNFMQSGIVSQINIRTYKILDEVFKKIWSGW